MSIRVKPKVGYVDCTSCGDTVREGSQIQVGDLLLTVCGNCYNTLLRTLQRKAPKG